METASLDRVRRLLPFRANEARTALLMFAYSFLAMTSYNILKPLTRSKFIADAGGRQPARTCSWRPAC